MDLGILSDDQLVLALFEQYELGQVDLKMLRFY